MKRHFKLLSILLSSLIITSVLFSCTDILSGASETIKTGEILDADIIESIIEAEAVDTTDKYPVDTFEDGSLIVYWLKGGSVWHKSLSCSSISNAGIENLLSGSISDAFIAGKERSCKNCSYDVEYTFSSDTVALVTETEVTTDRYPKNYDAEGQLTVYWIDGGSVWHESTKCSVVMDADPGKLNSGSAYDAYYAGKLRACNKCSADSEIVITDVTTEERTLTEVTTTKEYYKEYDLSGDIIVYWLENGSVWHESRYCSVIMSADPGRLHSGKASDAYYSGRKRPCAVCSLDSSVDVSELTTDEIISTVAETSNPYPKDHDPSGEIIVYWLENGSVWHESRYCSVIMSADPGRVHSGKASDAYYSGRKRPCAVCSLDSSVDVSEFTTDEIISTVAETSNPYPKDHDPSGEIIVYWLTNGSVWHESKNCGVLVKADVSVICFGDVYEAYYAGKIRACKICSYDSTIEIHKDFITSDAETTTNLPVQTEQISDMVYWVENGSVWHTSKHCSSLARTDEDDIFCGSVAEAKKEGKERECKRC